MNRSTYFLVLVFFFMAPLVRGQEIALLHYEGGGDWYANPTSLKNLIAFCNSHIDTKITPQPATVTSTDMGIMRYPFVHMTGHGNVFFSEAAVKNLRNYLNSGGFLHIDDNYGLDQYIRPEIKKLFPNTPLIEVPKGHPIYSIAFDFKEGIPKIHEHDGTRPIAYGIFKEGRLVLLYTTESDLGDGWEDPAVHNDPQPVRLKALKMGANIIKYVFEH